MIFPFLYRSVSHSLMLWPHRYEMSVLITKKTYISDNMCAAPRRGLELNASNAQRLSAEPEKQANQPEKSATLAYKSVPIA